MTPDQIAQASRHLAARVRLAQQPPLRGTPSAPRALAAIVAAGPRRTSLTCRPAGTRGAPASAAIAAASRG